MEPQPTPTPDQPNAQLLLTPDEFKALVTRTQKEANRITLRKRLALCATLIAIGLDSAWWLRSGSSACIDVAIVLVFVYAMTKSLAEQSARCNETEIRQLVRLVENTRDVRLLGPILELQDVVRRPGVG